MDVSDTADDTKETDNQLSEPALQSKRRLHGHLDPGRSGVGSSAPPRLGRGLRSLLPARAQERPTPAHQNFLEFLDTFIADTVQSVLARNGILLEDVPSPGNSAHTSQQLILQRRDTTVTSTTASLQYVDNNEERWTEVKSRAKNTTASTPSAMKGAQQKDSQQRDLNPLLLPDPHRPEETARFVYRDQLR